MPHFFKDFIIITLVVAIGTGFLIFSASHHLFPSQISSVVIDIEKTNLLPDSTFIKSPDGEEIYYVEKGKKRWIESKEAFRIQGFRSEDIRTLSADEISRYQDGELITAQSFIVLPQELDTLPDLAPLPIKNLLLKKLNGRTILKFTASFWNQGNRHFELDSGSKTEVRNGETYQEVYQPIAGKNGAYRNKVVGSFYWHVPHVHYHYSDFGDYVFSFVKPAPGTSVSNAPKTIRQKTTFCVRDNEPLSLTIPGAPKKAVFPTCGKDKQGISIGWVDVYKNTLPDQYIDINDMPAGIYALSFLLDPNQRFAEEHKDNNISTIFINLDVKKGLAKIIAAAAPFPTTLNSFPNETLIKTGGEGRIYVTHNNKKRLLNSSGTFDSYGYSWDNVFVLTQNMMDSIPASGLVRLRGTEEVYILNNRGYKRHILNPEIFYSYGFVALDIANINQTEFASYPESSLIRRANGNEIYLIAGVSKKKIGSLENAQGLGYDLDTIHTVNDTDFDSYTAILN
ncbi:MAG: lysyl oxidase family protein [Candidatus Taylorbacteria bacterium]|nr:lysyl oxidase family protein [Candidatus Taylorbacteria bacterium]